MLSISLPFAYPQTRITGQTHLHIRSNCKIEYQQRANVSGWIHNYLSKASSPRYQLVRNRIAYLPVACGNSTQGSVSGDDDDHKALETVLKLYKAIESKNLKEVSDIIGEECRCICNFVSTFQPFHGKEQVLAFFSLLMKNLGNKIEFVVQPTFHNGMNVGVSWKLEWGKNRVPLGKGFSFYMCNICQGKVLINNVDMFLEPILHIEPLRLKIMAFFTSAMDYISSLALSKGKAKAVFKIFFTLILIAIVLIFL